MMIRQADLSDAAAMAALSIEVWVGTYLREGVASPFADYALEAHTPQTQRALMADPRQHMLVATGTGGITGLARITFGAICPVSGGPHTEIATLYVQPRHKGQGIGTALLARAEAVMTAKGLHDYWLATNSENTPALGFYTAQGFDRIGTTAFVLDGVAYDNTVFSKTLSV